MLQADFFNRDAELVAQGLLGKVLRRKFNGLWLASMVVETEAYIGDKGSHSWLGKSPSRMALWDPPGTIYMYWSQGGDSFNVSVAPEGHAVLIKAGRPFLDRQSGQGSLDLMHKLNPINGRKRQDHKLLSGQSLFARSMNLKIKEWNRGQFDLNDLYFEQVDYQPRCIIQCRRLGIPAHRDPHLMLRFVDEEYAHSSTQNPLTKRTWVEGKDYHRIYTR